MIESLILAGSIFLLFLVAHVIIFRVVLPVHRWKTVQRTAIAFLFVYVVLYYVLPSSNWFDVLSAKDGLPKLLACANGAIFYLFLFLTYGQVYFLIDRGVSARILIEIIAAGPSGLTRDEIFARYSPEGLEQRRLDDMKYGQYVHEENGRYTVTFKGSLMGRAFLFLKHLLHLFPGG